MTVLSFVVAPISGRLLEPRSRRERSWARD